MLDITSEGELVNHKSAYWLPSEETYSKPPSDVKRDERDNLQSLKVSKNIWGRRGSVVTKRSLVLIDPQYPRGVCVEVSLSEKQNP